MANTAPDDYTDSIERFTSLLQEEWPALECQRDNDMLTIRIGLNGVNFVRAISLEIIVMAVDLRGIVNTIVNEINEASRQHEISMGRMKA